MRVIVPMLTMLLLGCAEKGEKGEPGARGADGAPGAKGDPGERGEAGQRGADGTAIAGARIVLWVDATGAVIGPEPIFIDDAGVQWPLDLETGEPSPSKLYEGVIFASNDCSGQAYAAGGLPRVAGSRELADGGSTFVVRDTTTRAVRLSVGPTAGSVRQNDGSCAAGFPAPAQMLVVPIEAFREVPAPLTGTPGPLRKEWR
jgi:hypothetical protein